MRSITDEEDQSTVSGETLNIKTEQNVCRWIGVKPFSAICSVEPVASAAMELLR